MFNALKYTRRMEEAGFSRNQAETTIDILLEVMTENLATKHDILNLSKDIQDHLLYLASLK